MARQEMKNTITGSTDSEITNNMRLFAKHHSYQEMIDNPDYDPEVEGSEPQIKNPESVIAFANKVRARQFKEAVLVEKRKEAISAIEIGEEITVE